MNGLKYFAKLILFICSYLPLFIILLLNYWSNRLVLNIILISIVIFSLISWFILFYLLKDIDCTHGKVYEVINISDESEISLNYLFTYIIPFLSMQYDNWKNLLSIGIILFITLVIYVNSNLIYMNPMLNISGYSILKITVKRNDKIYQYILITKSKNKNIQINENINICEFCDNIYYLNS